MHDQPPKLVVFDVDGTLTYRGSPTQTPKGPTNAAIEALDAIRGRAHLALVSGRSILSLRRMGHQLGIEPVVAELGGLLAINGTPPELTIPWDRALTPVQFARRSGLVREVLREFPMLHEHGDTRTVTVPLKGRIDPHIVPAIRGRVQALHPGFSLSHNGEEDGIHVLHLHPAGVGKPAGVRALQARFGVGPEDTIVLGDSPQDAACSTVARAVYIMSNGSADGAKAPNVLFTRQGYALGVAEALRDAFQLQ